jgi:hypothetical protein
MALRTTTPKETVNTFLVNSVAAAQRRQQLTVDDPQEFGRAVRDLGAP